MGRISLLASAVALAGAGSCAWGQSGEPAELKQDQKQASLFASDLLIPSLLSVQVTTESYGVVLDGRRLNLGLTVDF